MNVLAIGLNTASTSWWTYVSHATWQAALVAGVLLIVVAWGRRWPAPWRHALLMLALLKFAMPPFFPLPTGMFSQLGPSVTAAWTATARALPSSASETPAVRNGTEIVLAATRGPEAILIPSDTLKPGRYEPPQPERRASLHWKAWLMLVHLIGSAIVAVWIAARLLHLRRLARRGRCVDQGPLANALRAVAERLELKRLPTLKLSDQAASPMAFGVIRPTILLPASAAEGLTEAEMRTILAHELAHIRRGDLWVNWLQIALQTLWWFHPVLWLLNRALRQVREDCCDDLLLARGLTSQEAYCDTLLRAASRFALSKPLAGTLGFGERLHPLGRRLARIADLTLRRACRVSSLGVVLTMVLGALVLPGLRSQVPQGPPGALAREDEADPQAAARSGKSVDRLFDELAPNPFGDNSRQALLREELKQRGSEAVAFLTNELGNPTLPQRKEAVHRRRRAALLLGGIDPPFASAVVPALIGALKDKDAYVTEHAASSLGAIGPQAKEAIPALIEALRFKDWAAVDGTHVPPVMRVAAAQALVKIAPSSEEVADVLLEIFRDSSQPGEFREQLAYALTRMKTYRLEIEQAFIEVYTGGEPTWQETAASALRKLQPQTPAGLAIVRATNAESRRQSQGPPLATEKDIPRLVAAVQSPADPVAAQDAIASLTRLGKAAQPAVPALIDYLHSSNGHPASVVRARGSRGQPTAVWEDSIARANAAIALGSIGPGAKEAVPALITTLTEDSVMLRNCAAEALAEIGEAAPAAIPALVQALDDPLQSVRVRAAYALWRIDAQYLQLALPMLLEELANPSPHPLPGLKLPPYWAATKLGQVGPPAEEALPALRALLADPDPKLRLAVAEALWRIDPQQTERVVPVLTGLLKRVLTDEVLVSPRERIPELLGDIGAPAKAATPLLQICLEDEAEAVRTAAAEALQKINATAPRQ